MPGERDLDLEIPTYKICRSEEGPKPVNAERGAEFAGTVGAVAVSEVVVLVPACDPSGPTHFAGAAFNRHSAIRPLQKVAPDAGLVFEILAWGNDEEEARDYADKTVERIEIVANAYTNQDAYRALVYRE